MIDIIRDKPHYTLLDAVKQTLFQEGKTLKEKTRMAFETCPLDTPVWLIDHQHRLYIGTIVEKDGKMCRGECIEGDPEYFYRNELIAWAYRHL